MLQKASIENQLINWVNINRLQIQKFEHWDTQVKRIMLVDSGNDIYEIFVNPRPNAEIINESSIQVGVSLVKRGSKKYRAFHRERVRFTYTVLTSEPEIINALETCFAVAKGWILEAGHELKEIA